MTDKTEFGALLADIAGVDDMLKAVPKGDDDGKIAAAAAEGAGDGENGDTDADGKKDGEGEETLGKSLQLTDADGNPLEVLDATELLKSLVASVETNKSETLSVLGALVKTVKSQGDLIKSQASQIAAMGSMGRGRKGVVTIAEKPGATDLIKSLTGAEAAEQENPGLSGPEFLAKALRAAGAGAIAYSDANLSETYINRGQTPPPEIVTAVMAFKG